MRCQLSKEDFLLAFVWETGGGNTATRILERGWSWRSVKRSNMGKGQFPLATRLSLAAGMRQWVGDQALHGSTEARNCGGYST